MKKNILFLLLLTASAATLFTSCEAEADVSISKKPTTPSGVLCATSLSGIVTETGSLTPVEGCLITLQGATKSSTVMTDIKGQYRFSGIECLDNYRVVANKAFYKVGTADISADGKSALLGDISMTAACLSIVHNTLDFGTSDANVSNVLKYNCEGEIFYTVTSSKSWAKVGSNIAPLKSGQIANIQIAIDRTKLLNDDTAFITVNSSRGSQSFTVSATK